MGRAYNVRKASIQKKGAVKGKLFSIYAKEIYVAAKNNSDPEVNDRLKRLIERAKKDQVPSDIIKRAIEKARGAGDEDYEEVTYEGFGPGASTFIINCLTDNLNRTVSFVRAAFNKVNKTLGVTNSVAYNYDFLGIISFIHSNEEEILDYLLSMGFDIIDIESEGKEITITMNPSIIDNVKEALENLISNLDYTYDEVGMFAKEEIILNEEDQETFDKLLNLLNEIEDVNHVYHNVKLD